MSNKTIQKEILEYLEEKTKCSLGDMVKDLQYSYDNILSNLLDLKEQGKVKKEIRENGYFTLVK